MYCRHFLINDSVFLKCITQYIGMSAGRISQIPLAPSPRVPSVNHIPLLTPVNKHLLYSLLMYLFLFQAWLTN